MLADNRKTTVARGDARKSASGIDKPWIDSYPIGVPAEIDPDKYRSLVEVFEEAIAHHFQSPAFVNFGTTLSYGLVEERSRAFAAFLQHELRLAKGERVAIMLPNVLQYPIALFGALRAGLTVVNINPLYTPRELEHQLRDSGATAIVVLENSAHVLASCIQGTSVRHVIVSRIGDMLALPRRLLANATVRYLRRLVPAFRLPGAIPFREVLKRGADLEMLQVDVGPEDLAFLQYTGATTGLAKGVMLSHRNMVANLEQISAWLAPLLRGDQQSIVTALPLYHVFAMTANCLTFVKLGACNYLITDPRDLRGFLRELERIGFTAITGVNTLFNGLLNTPGFSKVDFSRLRLSLAGGMALQESVALRWKQVTGSTLIEAYGLTETSPAACVNPLDLKEYNGCIGLPLPSTEACFQDDSGRVLAPGDTGELCIRGPQVMVGYWQQPEETAKALTRNGWLRTGDIGQMLPNGYIRLVDRKKDMILVSGFNVYPNEVEAVISTHPAVREVGVIGVPDEHSGEAVMAVIVRKISTLSEEDVREHCRQLLTGFKRPKRIVFVDELPKTNVGKIARRELRALSRGF